MRIEHGSSGGELHGSSDVAGGELAGTSDSSDEPDGTGGRLKGISRAHTAGRALEGTNGPGGELHGAGVPARSVVAALDLLGRCRVLEDVDVQAAPPNRGTADRRVPGANVEGHQVLHTQKGVGGLGWVGGALRCHGGRRHQQQQVLNCPSSRTADPPRVASRRAVQERPQSACC